MLALTTTPGFASLWLIPRLTAFTRSHPGIDVRLDAGLGNRNLGSVPAKAITTGALFVSCALSWPIFLAHVAGGAEATVTPVLDWVRSGAMEFTWALRVDTLTAVMLGGELLVMVGNTAHALQVVGWLPTHPLRVLEFPYWAGLWFGLYATWEGLILQAVAGTFVVGSYVLAERLRERKRSAPKAPRTPAKPLQPAGER